MKNVRSMLCVFALATLACACGTDDEPSSDAGKDAGPIHEDAMVSSMSDAGKLPEDDAGHVMVGEDAGKDEEDAGPKLTPKQAGLCTSDYKTTKLTLPDTIRGTWQFNPGGKYVDLPESGYPCKAFLHDGDVRPALDDPNWTQAPDGKLVSFSETSTISAGGYTQAQFRYFRSLVFVPKDAALTALTVVPAGVDDSLYMEIFNSKYPKGISPKDIANTSDDTVGTCVGNGTANWDVTPYIQKGEVNVILLVHADLSPSISQLTSVDILADGASVQTFDCTDIH